MAYEDMNKDFEMGSYTNLCEWRNNKALTKFTRKIMELSNFNKMDHENLDLNHFTPNIEKSKEMLMAIRKWLRLEPEQCFLVMEDQNVEVPNRNRNKEEVLTDGGEIIQRIVVMELPMFIATDGGRTEKCCTSSMTTVIPDRRDTDKA